MKKIVSLMIIMLLITGCQQKYQNSEYLASINELRSMSNVKDVYAPFNINLKTIKTNETDIKYTLTISDAKEPIYDIEAIIIHDYPTNDNFPSTGIIDDKKSLVPNVINENSGYVKEIKLSGIINYENELSSFHALFKVKISYVDQTQVSHSYYYTKQL